MKIVVIKEDFCGACLALPLAFEGAGTATATSGETSENKSKSSSFFWSVVISIIGLIATVWFLSVVIVLHVFLKEIVEEEELEVWFVLAFTKIIVLMAIAIKQINL